MLSVLILFVKNGGALYQQGHHPLLERALISC